MDGRNPHYPENIKGNIINDYIIKSKENAKKIIYQDLDEGN